MDAFSIILQKYINRTANIYLYDKNECVSRNQYLFLQNIHTNELQRDMTDRDLHSIHFCFYMYIVRYETLDMTTKFKYFVHIMTNMFYTPEQKNIFLDLFSKMQRTYAAFSKIARVYKYKQAKLQVSNDLYMSPLTETSKQVISLMQNNNKYLFAKTDLIKIINNSLSNSSQMFSHPLPIKNPHTNVPFNKATLYNIYYFIKQSEMIMPPLFHSYFLSNFNLKMFRDNNQPLIRNICIEQMCSTEPPHKLYNTIMDMLKVNGMKRYITIDSSFPKKELIEIMKPYLNLYYQSLYSMDLNILYTASEMLKVKLKHFHKYNPQFGRKHINIIKPDIFHIADNVEKYKTITSYNTKHIPFHNSVNKRLDNKSHLQLIDVNVDSNIMNIYTEDDDDDDRREDEAQLDD